MRCIVIILNRLEAIYVGKSSDVFADIDRAIDVFAVIDIEEVLVLVR